MLTIYKASAGSGKTYNLVKEYIRLLLGVPVEGSDGQVRYVLNHPAALPSGHRWTNRQSNILAVTFTNKATEEMKSRIMQCLGSLGTIPAAGDKEADYAEDFMDYFRTDRRTLAEASRKALEDILNNFHLFNVSTIDSFFQTVMRTFARELDHQGDYGIMLEDRQAAAEGVTAMLDALNYEPSGRTRQVMSWLTDYAIDAIDNSQSPMVLSSSSWLLTTLVDFVSDCCSETFRRHQQEISDYLEDPVKIKRFRKYLKQVETDLNEATRVAISAWLRRAEDAGVAKRIKAAPEVRKIVDGTFRKIGAKLQAVLDWHPGDIMDSLLTSPKKNDLPVPEALIAELHDALEEFVRNNEILAVLPELRKGLSNLEFVNYVWHYIDKYRRENNLILLSDTNSILAKIISQDDAPFIYERIGTRLQNFLIDEFQDTSKMQWENLRPLLANSHADGHDNMIIGDVKQSIYRFRNADSSLLDTRVQQEDFPDRHVLRGETPAENTNYRSSAAIVRFNNTLFRNLSATLGATGYQGVEQGSPRRLKDQTGHILIKKYEVNEDDTSADTLLADLAANILCQHQRGYRWKDIVILVRGVKDATKVADYLLGQHPDITFMSDEALTLMACPSVKVIVGVLRLVEAAALGDDEQPVGISGSGGCYYNDNEINLLTSRYHLNSEESGGDRSHALLLALGMEESASQADQETVERIRHANPSTLTALVEQIIADNLTEKQRSEDYIYIAAFQDIVMDYVSLNGSSLHSFLKYLDLQGWKMKVSTPADADAVRIMTVHKSKGLQWACVHMPFFNWPFLSPKDALWYSLDQFGPECDTSFYPPLLYSKLTAVNHPGAPMWNDVCRHMTANINDVVNLAYVGFTRAERELDVYVTRADAKLTSKAVPGLKKSIGDYVMDELSKRCEENELMMSLSEHYDSETQTFEYGQLTTPEKEDKSPERKSLAPLYRVSQPEKPREMVSMDDVFSELSSAPESQGEEQKDITDPIEDQSRDQEQFRHFQQLRQRGERLHFVLSHMAGEFLPAETLHDLGPTLAMDSAEIEEYARVLEDAAAVCPEYISRWFGSGFEVLNERGIYDSRHNAVLRPDRVVIAPGGELRIIDYKFTTRELPSHRRQLLQYKRLYSDMGFRNIEGYLWYPDLGKVVEL